MACASGSGFTPPEKAPGSDGGAWRSPSASAACFSGSPPLSRENSASNCCIACLNPSSGDAPGPERCSRAVCAPCSGTAASAPSRTVTAVRTAMDAPLSRRGGSATPRPFPSLLLSGGLGWDPTPGAADSTAVSARTASRLGTASSDPFSAAADSRASMTASTGGSPGRCRHACASADWMEARLGGRSGPNRVAVGSFGPTPPSARSSCQ
mmetsp:Transcript_17289/g.41291  ORF Transcript_17289/g.41291 Transcript_17289/m.41291 type:complete len:210 (+) Transcript_17289:1097-1726(+)